MKNVRTVKFNALGNETGYLTPIEGNKDVDFDIKRIYYIYKVADGQRRGFHAHQDLKQVLICVKGKVDILVRTPFESSVITLDSPDTGLFIGDMIWREMFNFSEDAVLLVLANKTFSEDDYIKEYKTYCAIAKKYFGE